MIKINSFIAGDGKFNQTEENFKVWFVGCTCNWRSRARAKEMHLIYLCISCLLFVFTSLFLILVLFLLPAIFLQMLVDAFAIISPKYTYTPSWSFFSLVLAVAWIYFIQSILYSVNTAYAHNMIFILASARNCTREWISLEAGLQYLQFVTLLSWKLNEYH